MLDFWFCADSVKTLLKKRHLNWPWQVNRGSYEDKSIEGIWGGCYTSNEKRQKQRHKGVRIQDVFRNCKWSKAAGADCTGDEQQETSQDVSRSLRPGRLWNLPCSHRPQTGGPLAISGQCIFYVCYPELFSFNLNYQHLDIWCFQPNIQISRFSWNLGIFGPIDSPFNMTSRAEKSLPLPCPAAHFSLLLHSGNFFPLPYLFPISTWIGNHSCGQCGVIKGHLMSSTSLLEAKKCINHCCFL